MDMSLVFLILAIAIVGVLVFVAIMLTSHRGHTFDVEAYQTAWLKIENALTRDNKQSYPVAVVNADKLLDKALYEMGVPGKTMGERLKKSADKFTQLNSVWYAHKMRNLIAHEPDYVVEYNHARHALAAYKQALKDLGAI